MGKPMGKRAQSSLSQRERELYAHIGIKGDSKELDYRVEVMACFNHWHAAVVYPF